MFGQLRTSALGMRTGQLMLDMTLHNISNVNSTAYRSGRMDFADSAHAAITEMDVGAWSRGIPWSEMQNAPVDVGRGHGVRGGDTVLSQRSGPLTRTGVPTDLAIEGAGYLLLVRASGESARYTRDGFFPLEADGY